MKETKRILAMVLCLVMLIGLMPVSALAEETGESGGFQEISLDGLLPGLGGTEDTAESGTEETEEDSNAGFQAFENFGLSTTAEEPAAQAVNYPIYVLAGGDFQQAGDHANSAENVTNILAQISQKYETMNGFLFVGDYDCETHNDATQTASGIAALMDTVDNTYSNLNHDNSVLVQGNHDSKDSNIDATGGHDFDGYSVYVLNEDDYPDSGGTESGVKALAEDMGTWLNNKLGEGYDAPIFVVSHLPLAFGPRTNNKGDGKYAKYLFDVLNTAAENGLNIIFLHGHDHAYGADNYLGGEAIYLAKGDKINIAEAGSQTKWTEETLNFTYMNAGYTGYYNESGYVTDEGTDELTMTVFKIEESQVTVERYSANGLYNLKSAGRDGYYGSTSSSASNLGLAYNTTVYSSPQTIALATNNNETAGTIGEYVGVEDTVTDDVTGVNNGWVQIIAPVPGTTTGGTTNYHYTQDVDGVNSDNGYLIVDAADAVAMDNNGTSGTTTVNLTAGDSGKMIASSRDFEWLIDSNNRIYTTINGTNYYINADGTSISLVTGRQYGSTVYVNATSWDIENNDGQYKIYYSERSGSWLNPTYTNYYLTESGVTETESTVRLYSYEKDVVSGGTTTPDTNGTYGKIVGDLTYNATAGMTADQAMALVKDGIDGYYYEAMSTPGADVTGTKVDDSALTWEWEDTFDSNTAGDYAVKISYVNNGTKYELGTAEVVVPAATTYYIAEGNGMYYVDMNTSADNAMAVVKAGVTVSSATDASGSNKQTIDDSLVTWKWVDTYNGADSGPYTVEILYNGTSLGTVEVKVNVKYETGINTDWTYIGQTEATGGTHTYTLDTDGIDAGSGNKYIIVARDQAYLLDAGSAVAVTISDDGKTATTTTQDYEYYFTGSTSGLITRDGTNTLYQQNWGIHVGNVSDSNLDMFVNNGNGYYRIYDGDGTARSLYYDGSDWTVTSTNHTSSTYNVRLYKYTSTTGGTPAGPIYALIEGPTVYTVTQGSSATSALSKVKAGITGYTATDADGTGKTELADSDLTWKWKNTFNGNSTGSYWVEISYQGKVLGNVEVQVVPGVINNYPEYPNEGAVKVNKSATGIDFQSSGIAQVEVSASGVPSKKGVDVVIMLDTSSSMESWCVCGTQNCSQTGTGHQRRSKVLEESLGDLITQFQTPGDDDELLDIQVAIADFNGFYGDNHSSSGTPYDRDAEDMMSDDISYDANSEAKVYTGDGSLGAGAFISVEDLADSYTLNYTSGTNYDYAMDAAYQLASAKQEANGTEERDLFVIFLSDGAPMQWNYYHSQGNSSLWNNWITGAWTADQLSLNCATHAYYYDEVDHDGDGMLNEHRMANAIKGDPTKNYEVIRKDNDLGTSAGRDNMYMVPGLGATMFAISFGAQDDGNVTAESMHTAIDSIASPQGDSVRPFHYHVTTSDELTDAFESIGTEIAYAASNARFVDQMGDSFNLQMTPFVDMNGNAIVDDAGNQMMPTIEILTYAIYTKADADAVPEGTAGDTVTNAMIGRRKAEDPTVLETVRFSNDGKKAYSDQIDVDGDGIKGWTVETDGTIIFDEGDNILADGTKEGYVKGVIYAKTFYYNTNLAPVTLEGVNFPGSTGAVDEIPKETFYWKLGTVQTSELAMRYYVYLEGSMEGTKVAGSYKTNEFATLYYDNYLGNPCHVDTVSPTVAWQSATVSYAFYLVDEDGNVLTNHQGNTGTFANKVAVTNPVLYDEILLNNTQQVQALNVQAISDDVLPKYYELYDKDAVYEVEINSNATGSWNITKGEGKVNSTYVTNFGTNKTYSNELTMSDTGVDYTHTVVWFAVVWKIEAHPDSVVIDYGLPVDISVMTNDMFGDDGHLAGIGPYIKDIEKTALSDNMLPNFGMTYTGQYGVAKMDVNTGKVRYTPNTMEMPTYEKFAYAVSFTGKENAGYYYDTITVIPATSIYYEDSFLTFAKYNTDGTSAGTWGTEGELIEGVTQDEDRPGQYSLTDANNIYGYDNVNLGMSTYSLGQARKVHVDAGSYATATFTFAGTGFDVISMTSNTTGELAVEVSQNGETLVRKMVNTYYGYTQNEEGEWVATPDVEQALYQIPVIQIEELPYGVYDVKITATYATVFDKTTPAGYDLYLDAIRIYDPANDGAADNVDKDGNATGDATIENAYKADGEGWPSYLELRNMLIDQDTLGNAATSTKIEGLVFVDGDASVGDAYLSDYISFGPNNEVYLTPGQSVAFMLSCNNPDNVANIHIGIKSADGKTGTYTITNIAAQDKTVNNRTITAGTYYGARTRKIDTTTDMYYDMTDYMGDIIVITNSGHHDEVPVQTDGIISLTNIKSTYKENPGTSIVKPQYAAAPAAELAETGDEVESLNETGSNETSIYITPAAAELTVRTLNLARPVEGGSWSDSTVETEPEETVPETTVPEETVPETTVPEETVPETTVPEETVPETTIPEETVPETTVPEETVPETTVPEETVPETTIPEETEPEETEPFEPKVKLILSGSSVVKGRTLLVTVQTGRDVASLTVNGQPIARYTENRWTGTRTWMLTLKPTEVGQLPIQVVAYSETGEAAAPVTRTVNVYQQTEVLEKLFGWLFR